MDWVATIIDNAPKFTFVAFFTTALCAVVYGYLNLRQSRRAALESRLQAYLFEPGAWTRIDAIGASNPHRLVYDSEQRSQTLELLAEMRRLAKSTNYSDWDHAIGGPNLHRIVKAVSACHILIQVVRRTDLEVHARPVWNGHRDRFCAELLSALKLKG
jgi:hypothetical protein